MLVVLQPGPSPRQAQVTATAHNPDIQVVHTFDNLPGMAVEVTAAGMDDLLNRPDVLAVAPDLPVQAVLSESAAFIKADAAHQWFGVTGAGVNVAVLDTGLDLSHPDFAGTIVAQHCFNKKETCPGGSSEGASAQDQNGHGTHVSGIIAGRGQTGAAGIAPEAGLVAVRVLNGSGSGYTSDILAGIDWILQNQETLHVKVINLSLGGGSYPDVCDEADANTMLYAAAIEAARQAGITVFAASGNSGKTEAMLAPACIGGVVAVGNVYHQDTGQVTWPTCTDVGVTADQVACSSNSSPALDLLAPGVSINSTWLGGGRKSESGTSVSTPHAAGVAALMLQANPQLTPTELEATLKATGKTVTDTRNNRVTPRIDALAAVGKVSINSTIEISGTVLLQGRSLFSGTSVLVSPSPCESADFGAVAATSPDGSFLLTLPIEAAPGCLQVRQPGYLTAVKMMPHGNLGTTTLLAGDINGDNEVNILDLSFIATYYQGTNALADLNQSGTVDIFDLVLAAQNFKQRGPVEWESPALAGR